MIMIELLIDDGKPEPNRTKRFIPLTPVRNSRNEITSFRVTLDAVRNEHGKIIGSWIDCNIQPVHIPSCRVFKKRYRYVCNCGAREMFDKLVNEAGGKENPK